MGAFTHTASGKGSGSNASKLASYGIDELVDLIKNTVRIPKRNTKVRRIGGLSDGMYTSIS